MFWNDYITDNLIQVCDCSKDIFSAMGINGNVELVGKGYSVVDPDAPIDNEVGGNLNMKFVENIKPDATT